MNDLLYMIPVEGLLKALPDGSLIPRPKEEPWGDDEEIIISGPVSSGKEDWEGEILDQAGVWKALEYYRQSGMQVGYDHMYPQDRDPRTKDQWLIGQGIKLERINGRPYLTARLYKSNPLAQQIAQKLREGAKYFFSVYGPPPIRKGKRVIPRIISQIDVTPNPYCTETPVSLGPPKTPLEFAKSLLAGSGST